MADRERSGRKGVVFDGSFEQVKSGAKLGVLLFEGRG
jgi:hypothetical protein